MIDYQWIIQSMSTYPQIEGRSNAVCTVHWQCTGRENGFVAFLNGSTGITFKDSANFIPYDQLTTDHVLQWVFDSLDNDGVNAVKEDISNQLLYMSNVPVTLPNPWE